MTAALVISLLACATVSCLAGCGHPATEKECREIFEHSVKLELKAHKVTDPKVIAEHIKEAKAAKGEKLLKDCVGKRITDSALQCMREATTSAQLDKCLK